MTRTLACLVASMTAGAAFLDWMKPNRSETPTSDIGLMAEGPAGQPWRAIRLEARPQDTSLRPEDSHFLVYRNGDWTETPTWQAQRPLGATGMVRIALLAKAGSNAITPVQQSTAQKLVRALQEQYGIPGQRIVWADTLGLPPRSHSSVISLGPRLAANASHH